MATWVRRILKAGAVPVLCLGSALLSGSQSALAADHNDSAGIMGAEGSFVDITDVFAFRDPNDSTKLVLYVGLFTPEVAGPAKLFATNARYDISLDTNDDAKADRTVSVTFTDNADGTQDFHMTGIPDAGKIDGPVTPGSDAPIVVTDGPAKAFCGLRQDEFFFDLNAFKAFEAAPCLPTAGLRCAGTGAPQDFFLGRNTATIVVEFPIRGIPGITSDTSGKIRVWAKTFTEN